MAKKFIILVALCVGVFSISGCGIFAPFIQAWKNVGASEDDRMALLGPQIKKFGEALYWGKGDAVLFLHPEAAPEVRKVLATQREDMRVVETKVRSADYEPGAYIAQVELVVKYYRIPFYIVTSSIEKQVWKFEVGGTWRLLKRDLTEEFKR